MNKMFKALVSLVVSVAFISSTGIASAAVVVEKPVPIKIGGKIAQIAELQVAVRNVSDNLAAGVFDFNLNGAIDWAVANQYVLVDFKANFPEYGIHLLTRNKTDMVPAPGKTFEPKILNVGADGLPGTPDDVVSWGGLIDPNTCDNPTARADVAWRAYNGHLGNNVYPAIQADNGNLLADANEVTGNDNPATANWNADWKYLADEANTQYDVSFVRKDIGGGIYEYNYLMSAIGYGDGTAQTSPNVGGSINLTNIDPVYSYVDTALYIGANLATLPAGDYTAQMYVQLINE